MLAKLLSQYQLTGLNPNLPLLKSNIVYDRSNKTWKLSDQIKDSKSFLVIQKTSYSFGDFINFLNKNNKLINPNWATEFALNKQYKILFRAVCISV